MFMFYDYKSIEMRLFAYYLYKGFGDDSIIKEYEAGLDPHNETARGVYHVDTPTEAQRDIAKNGGFAVLYGAGVKKLAATLKITVDEAKDFREKFYDARPNALPLREKMEATLRDRGHVRTIAGRHLHVKFPHKVLNAIIQGTAADIMRIGAVDVHRELQKWKPAHIVNLIHDEIIIDTPRSLSPDLLRCVPERMKHPRIQEVIPMEVDVEWSDTNWAEKRPMDEFKLIP